MALVVRGHATLEAQGTLTPPWAPAPAQKSLQEIWDMLEALTSLVQQALPAAPGMVHVQGGSLVTSNTLNGTAVNDAVLAKRSLAPVARSGFNFLSV